MTICTLSDQTPEVISPMSVLAAPGISATTTSSVTAVEEATGLTG